MGFGRSVSGVAIVVVCSLVAIASPIAIAQPTASSDPAVTSCMIINSPGLYNLVADIESTDYVCMNITANDVVFNGGGHRINGTHGLYPNNTAAILVNASNVSIVNTVVTNWDYGIFGSLQNGTIQSNTLDSNLGGIDFQGGLSVPVGGVYSLWSPSTNNSIADNRITNDTFFNPNIGGVVGYGIDIRLGFDNNITNNTLSNYAGIFMWSGGYPGGFPTHNRVTGNKLSLHSGIGLQYNSHNVIADNILDGGTGVAGYGGISLENSNDNSVSNNTLSGGLFGIYLYAASNNLSSSATL